MVESFHEMSKAQMNTIQYNTICFEERSVTPEQDK